MRRLLTNISHIDTAWSVGDPGEFEMWYDGGGDAWPTDGPVEAPGQAIQFYAPGMFQDIAGTKNALPIAGGTKARTMASSILLNSLRR